MLNNNNPGFYKAVMAPARAVIALTRSKSEELCLANGLMIRPNRLVQKYLQYQHNNPSSRSRRPVSNLCEVHRGSYCLMCLSYDLLAVICCCFSLTFFYLFFSLQFAIPPQKECFSCPLVFATNNMSSSFQKSSIFYRMFFIPYLLLQFL